MEACSQDKILLAIKCFIAVIIPCNAWLFLQRIRALPSHFRSKMALVICTILWAATLSSFLVFPGFVVSLERNVDGSCVVHTSYNNRLLCAPIIAMVAFDTTTMIVISIGFAKQSSSPSWIGKAHSLMSTRNIGSISKVFLRSGQFYYMCVLLSRS